MKIKPEHITEYEQLLLNNCHTAGIRSLSEYLELFRKSVKEGKITVHKCEATAAFCRIMTGAALRFVCDVIYEYANDSHLVTLHKQLLKKHLA